MKIIQKFIICIIILSLAIFPDIKASAEVVYSFNEDLIYCTTVIEEIPISTYSSYSTSKTKTGSKTVYYKDANGNTLWYVKVTATFSYNGNTSIYKSASVTAVSCNSNWKVSNKSSSYSGNHGTASATGKKYLAGVVTSTINKSVTLTCSKNGTLS